MADRVVKVTLSASVADYLAQMGKAKTATDALGESGKKSDSLISKVGSGLKSAFSTAVGVINTAAVAATAFGAKVFSTGLQYNTLQQTSRAALKTILGSTEAVNAQMDKLDAFAKNSPFGKDIFIKGQQQMLSFGTATDKVIPRLDALQNAVAAAGGSGQTLSELIFVMSQIQAAGKITAEDLNQFGQRGVNAADMIGASMGKTGNEIRTMISKGTLDANQALDALTQGMATKFAGASANVKQTWSGTVDRIKAATREIGAAMAEPFISQAGGGLFVTWGNKVADVLQAVRQKTAPVVEILTLQMLPAFQRINSGLDTLKAKVTNFDPAGLNTLFDTVKQIAPAVGLAAGAYAGFSSSLLAGVPILGRFLGGLNPVVGALVGITAASPELRSALTGLASSFTPLVKLAADVAKVLAADLNSAVPIAAGVIRTLTAVISPLVSAIGAIPAPILTGVAAFIALQKVAPGVVGGLTSVISAVKEFGLGIADSVSYQKALQQGAVFNGEATGRLLTFGAALSATGGLARTAGSAILSAMGGPVGLAIAGVSLAVGVLTSVMGANAQAAERQQQRVTNLQGSLTALGATTDQTTSKIADGLTEAVDGFLGFGNTSTEDFERFFDQIGSSSTEASRAVLEGGDALEQYKQRIIDAVESGDVSTLTAQRLIAAIDQQSDALQRAQRNQDEANRKTNEGKDALRQLQGGFEGATDATDKFADAIKGLGSKTLDLNDANRRVRDAIRDMDSALTENGKHLDDGTEAGDKNGDALDSLAKRYQTAAAAAYQASGNQEDVKNKLLEGRDAYIKYAEAMGKSEADAAAMADALGLTADAATDVASAVKKANDTELNDKTFTVSDDGTIDDTQQNLDLLKAKVLATPDKEITITEPLSDGIKQKLADLGYKVMTLPNGQVTVNATDNASGVLETIKQKMFTLDGQIATVTVRQQMTEFGKVSSVGGVMQAQGGVMSFYANGGLNPMSADVAQMVPANTWRVIGDRAKGDEAFIPIDGSARSRAILAETTRRMALFAQGAVVGGGSGGGTVVNVNIAVNGRSYPNPRDLSEVLAVDLSQSLRGVVS